MADSGTKARRLGITLRDKNASRPEFRNKLDVLQETTGAKTKSVAIEKAMDFALMDADKYRIMRRLMVYPNKALDRLESALRAIVGEETYAWYYEEVEGQPPPPLHAGKEET